SKSKGKKKDEDHDKRTREMVRKTSHKLFNIFEDNEVLVSGRVLETADLEREQAKIALERARTTRDREDSTQMERLMNDVVRLSATMRGLGPDADTCARETC
ncbi:unnamed protein product, partial [Laminaria digitata]